MTQEPHTHTTAPADRELLRAKMELIAARERGERGTLGRLLTTHPAASADLVDFEAALMATSAYGDVVPTSATQVVAERARARAFTAVFGADVAPASASAPAASTALSLKVLRQERKLTLRAVAARLDLGVDVLSSLEAGRIRAQSVPERLAQRLSEVFGVALDTISGALQAQPSLVPALQRANRGVTGKTPPQQPELDFAEAVQLSPEMSDAEKAAWLEA